MLFQRICAFFIAVWSFIAAAFGFEAPLGNKVESFRVTSYVIADRILSENSLCKEDFDIITNVILFGCATFETDGSVSVNKEVLATALNNINAAKGNNDIVITLNLLGPQRYGDSDVYNEQMAYQAELHTMAFRSGNLEKNVIDIIEEFGLDGVHFDYEYPISDKAWKEFNKFLVSLKKQMPDKKLGVAISSWDIGLNTKALDAVDYIELMLYDNYDNEGRHSTTGVCKEDARKAAINGLPMNKVNFGLPFYARPTDRDAYWYAYCDYYNALDENGFYKEESTGKAFWFNTPDVISEKTKFAIDNGFGGVMIWHYSCDLPSTDQNSLLNAINHNLSFR